MNFAQLLAFVFLGLGACLPAASSIIIYGTGAPPLPFSTDPANGYHIIQGGPAGNTFMAVAESFTPVTSLDLSEIDLPVGYVSGTNAFTLEIESGASQPTTLVEAFNPAASVSNALLKIMSVAHPLLTAGTNYWIVVTTTGNSQVEWFVDPFNSRITSVQFQGSSAWNSVAGATRPSVLVLGDVPEPSSAGLCVAGFALFAVSRRRTKRRRQY